MLALPIAILEAIEACPFVGCHSNLMADHDSEEVFFDERPEHRAAYCEDRDVDFEGGRDDHDWRPPGEVQVWFEAGSVLDNLCQTPGAYG